VTAWLDRSRLNAARGIRDHLTEPRMKSAINRLFANTEQAITNLDTFLAQGPAGKRREPTPSADTWRIPTPDTASRG